MNEKKVSIVICTYNRAPFLTRTLESLKHLTYKNFEVIVVNGPSTDETEQIINRYKDGIKIRNNPLRNLSVSRNIGIKAAAGEIIAFIDDDAIPEPEWLSDVVEYYTDDHVGGVGGKVFGPGGDHFQFTNGIIDVWGDAVALRDEPGNFNDADGNNFNILMGTNCSFSKIALEAVGGFDEYYEYYHDESDLAVRIIRAGYKILHHPKAYIHHEFAKSHIRTSIYKLNWYPIVKNTVYFGLKNSEGGYDDKIRVAETKRVVAKRMDDFKIWYKNGLITKEDYQEFSKMWDEGVKKGTEDGMNSERILNFDLKADSDFFEFDARSVKTLTICLLSQDYPPDSVGGIAKYTWELAKGFAESGHNIHIITRGNEIRSFLLNNVNIHTITAEGIASENIAELQNYPTTYKSVSYSYQIYKRIVQLHKQYKFDIVETPIWDYEGLITATLLDIPVITRLETPLLKAVETQKWNLTEDLILSSDLEKKMIEKSTAIISISNNIKDTISDMYCINIDEMENRTIYLGMEEANPVVNNASNGENIRVLFVGRLERRKGIHLLLDVIPELLRKHKNLQFDLVGDDSLVNESGKTYKEIFLKENKGSETCARVTFHGKVDDEKLHEMYRNCDLFVAPSLYESFGLVFLEAMRYAKPVIGCKAGGMQEIIKDGYNGMLVEAGSKEALYEAIDRLVIDTIFRNGLGENGLKRFKEQFTRGKMVDETLKYYKEISKKEL